MSQSEKEPLPFLQVLERLDSDLLPERCSWCGTYHPRYSVVFHSQKGQKKDETYIPGGLLHFLGKTKKGKRRLDILVEFDGASLADPDNHQVYATVVDHTLTQPYTCEEQRQAAQRAYEEAMAHTNPEYLERVQRVLAMLAPGWEQPDEEDYIEVEDEVLACCQIEFMNGKKEEERESIPMRACGSVKLKDTAKALYRLCYLFRPTLSFEDMYNECLLILTTPDGRFSVAVRFHKYEMGLYFYAETALVRDVQEGYTLQVRTGIPGIDNGLSIQHEEGLAFFQLIQDALNHPWMAYAGNDFEV